MALVGAVALDWLNWFHFLILEGETSTKITENSLNSPNFAPKKTCKIRLLLIFFFFKTQGKDEYLKKVIEHYKIYQINSFGHVVLL